MAPARPAALLIRASRSPARPVARELGRALEAVDHPLLREIPGHASSARIAHGGATLLVREEHRDTRRHRARIGLRQQDAADAIRDVPLRQRVPLGEYGD